jgi:hypothetical protein
LSEVMSNSCHHTPPKAQLTAQSRRFASFFMLVRRHQFGRT